MKKITTSISVLRGGRPLFIAAFLLASCSLNAEEQSEIIFSDDFENRSEVGKNYVTSLGDDKSWTVEDGILIARQTKESHGCVIRKEHKFDDLDVKFDFRFTGGKSFNFVIDDKNEKSVHAGHICRVSIFPKRIVIGDDKTGNMNLEIRGQRQNKDLPAAEKKKLEEFLSHTQSSAAVDLETGQWYTMRVRLVGDLMEAYLDGKLITSLKSPGISHPTKTKFGFTVNGSTIDFDNLAIYQNPK
ncbi:family 16 glycoside hydrolase [Luteolibacter algae]|uniref:Family 16 glycoside hydrolase n=1 Tax=Luteolibacter algae TaxID=454151 RepID=A0ABW5D5F3_9BACT